MMSPLKSLPDRTSLINWIDELTTANKRIGLLVFNLNRFRDINIKMGHVAGDQVLQTLVERVSTIIQADDRLFRVGGDEFAVVLSGLRSLSIAETAAARVLEVIAAPMEVADNTLSLSAHAGVAVYPDQVGSREELLRAADTSLHEARCSGRGYKLFDALLRDQSQIESDLKGKLKIALENNDLLLHYQPQIDLRRSVFGGCEALTRWNHDTRGWINPELFIAVAETGELIDTLTYWCVNVALREWSQYCSQNSASVPISVNLSARLLHSPEIVDLVARALNIWGVPEGSLVMEVTESAMMTDPEIALQTLTALNELGVTISIDDFGTGYSSLAYLKKLPVGELKIDKSFVSHMAESSMDRKIVQSVIDLAHNLEIKVVAEGVEDKTSLDLLESMGCDLAQGYYIAKPMPLSKLPGWLEGSRWDVRS